MEQLIQQIMSDQGAAGLAAAVVDKQGKIIYQGFFGYRDVERELPINEDTIFGLASITKSFTALAILKMEEAGLLKLDDPVADYLPEYTCANQPKPVTIRHFLSHAGGYFPLHRTTVEEAVEKLQLSEAEEGDLAYSETLAREGCRLVAGQMDAQTKLLCKPGERMSYCNDGFGLLSEIIRRYGDQNSFPEYLKEHILTPLGMSRSCADFLTPAADPNAATLYSGDGDTSYADHDYHRSAFVLGGGGAMKSTLKDMCRYLTMYLNYGMTENGERLLNAERIREMAVPRQDNGPASAYGYGLSSRRIAEREVWGHGGSLPGVSSNFAFSWDLGLGVIVLCNTENVSVQPIADALLRYAIGENPLSVRKKPPILPWDEAYCRGIVGNYSMDEGENFTIEKEGESLTLISNGRKLAAYPISERYALIPGKYSDNFIEPVFDNAGRVYAARYGSRVYPKVTGQNAPLKTERIP